MRTALHSLLLARGATLGRDLGWDLAMTVPGESPAAAVVLADESPVGKFQVEGKAVPAPAVPAGHRYQVTPNRVLWVVPFEQRAAAWTSLVAACAAGGCAHPLEMSSCYASLLLAGPQAAAVLQKVSRLDLRTVAVGGMAATALTGSPVILGRRATGWRILVGRDEAEDAWEQLERAGEEFGLTVAGWAVAKGWLWRT